MDYKVTDTELISIANAIRSKSGTSDLLEFPDEFVSEINNIPSAGTYETKTVAADFSSGNMVVTPDTGYDAMTSVTVLDDPNDIPANIKKGVTMFGKTGTYEGEGYAPIPSKDVDFYDYDGTRLYSYTADEFAELAVLPPTPSHDRLTCEGWNWSLEGAKSYVAAYGILDIGATFYPTDEKVHLFIELEEPLINPKLGIYVNQTPTTISWGDGSPDTVLSTTGEQYISSPYTHGGKYEITIDGKFRIVGAYNYSKLFTENGETPTTATQMMSVYSNILKEAWIGNAYNPIETVNLYRLPNLSKLAVRKEKK